MSHLEALAGRPAPSWRPGLANAVVAETIGTAFLLIAVVGSGVAAHQAFPDEPGLALAVNALTTGATLTALIMALAPISSAFNPAVTLVQWAQRQCGSGRALALVGGQLLGAAAGVVCAHAMFALPAIAPSSADLLTASTWFAEIVATFGLVLFIALSARSGDPVRVAVTVGAYIAAAVWFTSSTAFANPAATMGRVLTDTFTGIDPSAALAFVTAQLIGASLALLALRGLYPSKENHDR